MNVWICSTLKILRELEQNLISLKFIPWIESFACQYA